MPKLEDLLKNSKLACKTNVPASKCTTITAGGAIKLLVEPNTVEELSAALRILKGEGSDYRVLGAGSNLIIADKCIQTPVIRLGRGFRRYEATGQDGVFEVSGSMPLMTLSRELCEKGYSGLEFAGGIPASLGGAVRMNAGAHKAELSSVLDALEFYDSHGERRLLTAAEMNFTYRNSNLPDDAVVTRAWLKLKKGNAGEISEKRRKFLDYRKSTQPLSLPSFGSVFKNVSMDQPAGALIESCGLKGFKIGGAMISELHANWIVNPDRTAKIAEIIELMELAERKVMEQTGNLLEREVRYWL